MRIDKVILNNFRCFEQLEVTFHPQMTVLIAPNGAGKTTILDAVRIALWPFVKGFDLGSQTGKSATIQIDDVRLRPVEQDMEPTIPSSITAIASNIGNWRSYEWTQIRDQVKARTQTKGDSYTLALTRLAKKYQSAIYEGQKSPSDVVDNLPLLVYLGTGRLWYQGRYTSEAEDKKLDSSVFSRLWGYQNCLTATSSYKQFENWYVWVFKSYRELQGIQLEKQLKSQDQIALVNFAAAIKVVQTAINTLTQPMTGWHDLQYRQSMGQQLVMEHPDYGYIPIEMLSDGLRNMVAMISDIAFRCIKLNPHLGEKAAKETKGIVLIDEVDMFLHPAWQQTVLASLQKAFPKIQFIVTTHSPQVLTTVAKENIRRLGSDKQEAYAKIPDFSPLAHESSDALAKVMETNSQPSLPLQEIISEYEFLIRTGKEESERAGELLKILEHAGYQFHESDLVTWRFLAQRQLAKEG